MTTQSDSRVPTRDRVVLGLGAAAMLTVLLVSCTVILGQRSWSPLVTGDSLIVVALSLAGVCSVVAVTSLRGALRRAWLLLATMIVLNVAGGVLWLIYGDDPGSPRALSVADALYLVAIAPLFAGLVLYPMARGLRRTWGPLLLDGLVLGSSLLLLTALLGLDEINRSLTGGEAFVHLFYPVSDILMVSLILVLLLRSAGRVRIDVALLGMAFAAFAVADISYVLTSARGVGVSSVYQLGYICAALLFAAAALAAVTLETLPGVLQRNVPGTVAPILPDLAAFGALGACAMLDVSGDVQLVLIATVLALAALRQLARTAQNHQLRRDLELRVAERTEEVRLMTEEHRRLDAMKREFVSAVSHELRTPLTAIRGALEMLADGDVGTMPLQAQPVVEMATRGSERLSRLVNEIIDLERLESGSFGFHPVSQDLHPLLADAVESLSPIATEAGVHMRVSPVAARVVCDGDRVTQALVNLVGNALKFTAPGGTVTIVAAVRLETVQISITDTGRGIPAAELAAIFDRFHQVEPDDSRENAGTGLGLAITQRIIQKHGGRIWVESALGQGSTFHFTLPLDRATGQPRSIKDRSGPIAARVHTAA